MHRLIRNTHLVLGLGSVLFILTYAVSALQMSHRIALKPEVDELNLALPAGLAPRPLAETLMQQRGYEGELGAPGPTPTGFRVTISRPGTMYTISYDTATGQTRIQRQTRSFLGMLNRLHHQNGLHHEDGRLNAWGWALALVSVVLLLMGATGVYLWFLMHRERTVGAVLLAANLVVSLVLLGLLRK